MCDVARTVIWTSEKERERGCCFGYLLCIYVIQSQGDGSDGYMECKRKKKLSPLMFANGNGMVVYFLFVCLFICVFIYEYMYVLVSRFVELCANTTTAAHT